MKINSKYIWKKSTQRDGVSFDLPVGTIWFRWYHDNIYNDKDDDDDNDDDVGAGTGDDCGDDDDNLIQISLWFRASLLRQRIRPKMKSNPPSSQIPARSNFFGMTMIVMMKML